MVLEFHFWTNTTWIRSFSFLSWMTVFLPFKMFWYLHVSDSSYLINHSIFLKLSIFSCPFSCLWRSAMCSDLRVGGPVYWRMCTLGKMAGSWQVVISTVGDLRHWAFTSLSGGHITKGRTWQLYFKKPNR